MLGLTLAWFVSFLGGEPRKFLTSNLNGIVQYLFGRCGLVLNLGSIELLLVIMLISRSKLSEQQPFLQISIPWSFRMNVCYHVAQHPLPK